MVGFQEVYSNFSLTLLPTGDYSLGGPKTRCIIKANEVDRSLFLLNVSLRVREALKVEMDELVSTYWEFDKDMMFFSEWIDERIH